MAIVGGLALFGMKGLMCGVVINAWFSYLVNAWLVAKYIGLGMKEQFKDIFPVFAVSLLASAGAYFSGQFVSLGLYGTAAIELLVFVLLYLGWALIFKPLAYQDIKSLVTDFLKKRKHQRGK